MREIRTRVQTARSETSGANTQREGHPPPVSPSVARSTSPQGPLTSLYVGSSKGHLGPPLGLTDWLKHEPLTHAEPIIAFQPQFKGGQQPLARSAMAIS